MKRCYRCGETLDDSKFYSNKSKEDGLATYCIECQRVYNRRYVEAGNANRKKRKIKMSAIVNEYKTSAGCCVCGEKDHACLVFHHKGDDKIDSISNGIQRGWSEILIFAEIAKCDVLCSNCHMKLHYKERNNTL